MYQGIEVTSNDYNNYIGKYSSAMISSSHDDFTIIFQTKDSFKNNKNADVESSKEIYLPLLVLSYKELIKKACPDVRILYNNVLNVETLLSGLIIGKIFRDEDTNKINDMLVNKINDIYNDELLKESLKPLIEEANNADDYDFSTIEDKMYDILEERLNSYY